MTSPKKIIQTIAVEVGTAEANVEAFLDYLVAKEKSNKWTKTGILKAFERPDSPVGQRLIRSKK